MQIIKSILKFIDNIINIEGKIVVWFLILLNVLILFEVVTRRFFGKPTIWTFEILAFTFCAVVMLSLGYAHLHDAHAKVDVFTERLSPRKQAILDVILFIPFLGLLSVVMLSDGIIYAQTSWAMLERTPSAFNAPIYPVKTLIPIGIGFLLLAGISRWVKSIIFLIKGEYVDD